MVQGGQQPQSRPSGLQPYSFFSLPSCLEGKAAKLVAEKQGVTPLYQTAAAHLISSKVGGVHFTLLRDALYRYAYWK